MLAAAYAAATEILTKRDDRPGLQASIALFATGTLAALALALTFALEKGWLTIALALMSAGTAWISTQRPIPFLRALAAILAGIVVLRIVDEPRIVGEAVGTTPIFNWLLWGYGIPAVSFWAGSIFLRRGGDDAPLRTVEAAAILFTVLLAFMEIRHAVNNGDVYRQSAGLTEVALQVCVALAMAIGLERLRIRTGSVIHNAGAILLTVFAGLAALFGLLLLENPILWSIDVGGIIINLLLLGYALPAVLALLLSYAVAGRRPVGYANTIAAGALVLALAYVTFEIRQNLSRPGPRRRPDHRRRAIHLLDRVPGVRRGAARHRHSLQLAARAAGVGGRHRTDDPESLPDRHVDADGRLPRAVVHVPGPGAGGDRLAVPADPVPQAGGGAGRAGCTDRRLIAQAALTELRNLPTSSLSRLLSLDSDFAAEWTCADADPVSVAPCCTSVMLEETCCVPVAACWMLRDISCVAAPCSSTAAAIVEDISDIRPMVSPISLIAATESWVAA